MGLHWDLQAHNEVAFWRAWPALGSACSEVGKQLIHQGCFLCACQEPGLLVMMELVLRINLSSASVQR